MPKFKKPIDIELLKEANDYFETLPDKIQTKFFVSFDKTKVGLKGDWFKSIGDEIWEFRQRDSQKFYRLLAFWDKTKESETLIVATHGFNKKTNKTPKSQKKRAIRIKREYFDK
ncbi:MAG: type II toxin-antitoxin system RelE/ParE family toxin [Saprospiraceae bacterium]|nr:type II toxin-antitoxin system RelE/ParE family toxin [Saprospiraceae bacterium]